MTFILTGCRQSHILHHRSLDPACRGASVSVSPPWEHLMWSLYVLFIHGRLSSFVLSFLSLPYKDISSHLLVFLGLTLVPMYLTWAYPFCLFFFNTWHSPSLPPPSCSLTSFWYHWACCLSMDMLLSFVSFPMSMWFLCSFLKFSFVCN